jgi:hypothetical protein
MADIEDLMPLIKQFMPFAKERMGFQDPPKLFLKGDSENASNPLGRTAFYDPAEKAVTLYITGRHPKDIMRSLSHELVHHRQNCNGDFKNAGEMGEGYAQNNPHMREMERQAYEIGNMCFRDWEDSIKQTIYFEHLQKGDKTMSTKDWKNQEIKSLLSEAWGFKMDLNKLTEDVGGAGGELTKKKAEEEDEGKAPVSKREKEGNLEEQEELEEGEKGGKDWHKTGMKKGQKGAHDKDTDYSGHGERKGDESDTDSGATDDSGHGDRKGDKSDTRPGHKDYLQEDSGEEEAWHQWKNEHADDDHIREIEHHLRALKDDRDHERDEAEYDHDKYEDEGYDRRDERRGRGRDREGMEPDARRRPLEEEKLRAMVRKVIKDAMK